MNAQPMLWADAPPFEVIGPYGGATPVERHNDYWFKRDDTYEFAGIQGGKVRTCLWLAREAKANGKTELVTAGSRSSPQVSIVARVAKALGMEATVYVPWALKDDTPEVADAQAHGAVVLQVKPGHNSVIIARANEYARLMPYRAVIPFGMECWEAVRQTCAEYLSTSFPSFKTLHVPVGSGMSLAGILWGMYLRGDAHPVIGWQVGADPTKRLDHYAPKGWRDMVDIKVTRYDYHQEVHADLGFVLDPIYEAKCAEYLGRGDLLWCVGKRATLAPPAEVRWQVSAAWATKRLDCTLHGITKEGGCGGGCCKSQAFWPPTTGQGQCAMLTATGCAYQPVDRPVTCLLYPMRLNGSNTLVGHLGMTRPHSHCAPNYVKFDDYIDGQHQDTPYVIDAIEPQFSALFGRDQWERVRADVIGPSGAAWDGTDSYVVVPRSTLDRIELEAKWEAGNIVPAPRGPGWDVALTNPDGMAVAWINTERSVAVQANFGVYPPGQP